MVKEKFRANVIDYLWFCGERHGFRINGDSLLGILLGSIVFLPLLKVVDILNLNVSFRGNGGSMLEFAGFLFPFLFLLCSFMLLL